ncbi:MAG TPA: hypothetical protein VI937_01850 [Negativicutes bacterium]|nr:hypothetical protein [Negativicutes bacterium]
MRLFPLAVSLLIGFALGVVATDAAQDKDGKKKEVAKQSLVQKHAKESVKTLMDFPYPDMPEGKKLVERVTSILNSAEDLFEESAKLRKESKSEAIIALLALDDVMIARELRNLTFFLALRKDQWITDGKLSAAKYTIDWNGRLWAVKELPKKDKK